MTIWDTPNWGIFLVDFGSPSVIISRAQEMRRAGRIDNMGYFRVIIWEDNRSRHLTSFGEDLALGIQVGNPLEPLRIMDAIWGISV